MAGAEAEAKKNNWPVVITILDSGGTVVLVQRLDGAQFGSVEVSRDKAYSAVAFRRPTKAFEDGLAQGGANLRQACLMAGGRSSSTARLSGESACRA